MEFSTVIEALTSAFPKGSTAEDYTNALEEEGVTSFEDLCDFLEDASDEDLKGMGITKAFHIKKIRKMCVKKEEVVEPAPVYKEPGTGTSEGSPFGATAAPAPAPAPMPVVQERPKDQRSVQLGKLQAFYQIYNPSKADDLDNMNHILDEYSGDYQSMWKNLEQKYILGKTSGPKKKKHLNTKSTSSKAEAILEGIAALYRNNIRDLENRFKFPDFHSPLMDDIDFLAKPIVLLVGQYSVGKTSFIKYLLQRDFPGSRIGPEPTTDSFMAVMHGQTEKVIPGNAAVMDRDLPFRTLQRFGIQFLNKFSVSQLPAPILESISFLDTPGILSGEKQRLGRLYDFAKVVEQFAHRADRILLLFDAHKLDISDEFRGALEMLKGHDDKVRCILNKADQVPNQQLLRVYGALMWSLGKVFKTPEVLRVFVGSFWDNPYDNDHNADLFDAEAADLISDLKALPRHRVTRKINEFVKRTRQFKVHLIIIKELRSQFGMFGKSSTQTKILQTMPQQFKNIAEKHNLTLADFPNPNKFVEIIKNHDIAKFDKVKDKYTKAIDQVLNVRVTEMMKLLPSTSSKNESSASTGHNPFAKVEEDGYQGNIGGRWVVTGVQKSSYDNEFHRLQLNAGRASATQVAEVYRQSGLSDDVLGAVWNLVAISDNGTLDSEEFALGKWLIEYVSKGNTLPPSLTATMIPPGKRQYFQDSATRG